MSTKIAKKEETGLVIDERPDFLKDDGPARGSEEVTSNDISLPRLNIVQDLSPQHKKTKPEYIEGAEVGDIFNTASQELYKGEIMVIPVYYRMEWIVWKDQKKGGGFFGSFDSELEAAKALPKIVSEGGGQKEDYEIVDTAVHFVILLKEGSTASNPIMEQAVISMSKSQMKISRKWNTVIKMAGGDRFSRIYKMKAIDDKNQAGQEYKNWSVMPIGYVSKAMYEFAEQTYDSVKSGKVKAGHAQDDTDAATSSPKKAEEAGFDDEFAD